MYRHILIPTDGSDISQQAVSHAFELAKAIKARITLVTVTKPFHIVSFEVMQIEESQDSYDSHMVEWARAILESAAVKATTEAILVETMHVIGEHPYQCIIDTALERGCDLIVMASHGRGGLAAMVLGSETVKVLTHSKIPVLVVRPDAKPS
jgi:nucleotide-binding universal stress UspA family protein